MTQKSFEFDKELAGLLKEFCKTMTMVEKRLVAAATLNFLQSSAEDRERMLVAYRDWLDGEKQSSRGSLPRIAAKHGRKPFKD